MSLAILSSFVSFRAFIKYNQEGAINWALVFILFFTFFIANYFGAKFGNNLSVPIFKKIYVVILIIIAFIYFNTYLIRKYKTFELYYFALTFLDIINIQIIILEVLLNKIRVHSQKSILF